MPLYLVNWKITERVPPEANRAELNTLRQQADQKLIGADVKQFAVAMATFWDFVRVFQVGKEPADIEAATKMFRKALEDVPVDLLETAVQRLITTWKWGSKFPLPADIRSHIEEDLTMRQHERRRVQHMLDAIDRQVRSR